MKKPSPVTAETISDLDLVIQQLERCTHLDFVAKTTVYRNGNPDVVVLSGALALDLARQARSSTTLRAENERLRAALDEMLRTHGGVHDESCDAYGCHDDDVNARIEEGVDCDCGAIEIRNRIRAALKEGT